MRMYRVLILFYKYCLSPLAATSPRVMGGRSVGYVNMISESTESNKRYLSDKMITLYKLCMVM